MEEITVLKGDLSRDEMHVVVYTLFSLFSSSVESKNEKKVKKKHLERPIAPVYPIKNISKWIYIMTVSLYRQ